MLENSTSFTFACTKSFCNIYFSTSKVCKVSESGKVILKHSQPIHNKIIYCTQKFTRKHRFCLSVSGCYNICFYLKTELMKLNDLGRALP